MRFYTPVQISQNQARTKEGYLVCLGSAIARTGFQLYSAEELNVPAGPDGVIRVERDEDEVFHPDTIASFEGKDIVIDHPSEDVVPANWRELSCGHIQNVRRGTGVEDHLLLADLMIKDPKAIAMVLADSNQELSCGYDARYKVYSPGRASQVEIRGNHVAFVKNGRCGAACSTKDSYPLDLWGLSQPVSKSCTMTSIAAVQYTADEEKMSKLSWLDRAMAAFKTKDEAAFTKALDEATESASVMKKTGDPEDNESHTHVHLHLGGPETTAPEGGLPETGEARVSNANDNAGGETSATFGGKTFFADKVLDEAFKGEMGAMKDSVEALSKMVKDGFEEFKKEAADRKAAKDAKRAAKDAKRKAKDQVEGEESAKETPPREIEGGLKEEAPPGTSDEALKAKDSAMLEDSFAKTISLAEILVPGIAVPTFDKALDKETTYGAICALRRNALSEFAKTEDGAKIIAAIEPNRTLDAMQCRDVAPLFRAAAAMQVKATKDALENKIQDSGFFAKARDTVPGPKTLADVQKMNESFWASQTV